MRRLLPLLAVLGIAGCQAGYYAHLVRGQYELIAHRTPITKVLAQPDLDPRVRTLLERALDAREFASRQLLLPDNGSYRLYADIGRPVVLWNIFATPEFSLKPHQWCYFIAGCFAYRGWYERDSAQEEADALRGAGFDVHIGGVPAYSTLGWFDDPVLNTLLTDHETVSGTIFHELAHQVLFVGGDTAFNESFATFIQQEGMRQYFREEPDRLQKLARRQKRDGEFVGLMLGARRRLEQLYKTPMPAAEMRARKAKEIARLREQYAAAKQRWNGEGAYDFWLEGDLNNARLMPFGLYHQWVPAFAALYARAPGDWAAFQRAALELSRAPQPERIAKLTALAPPPILEPPQPVEDPPPPSEAPPAAGDPPAS
jgi:predicted aminopeptidase